MSKNLESAQGNRCWKSYINGMDRQTVHLGPVGSRLDTTDPGRGSGSSTLMPGRKETSLLLSPITSHQCRSGDVLSRERDWMDGQELEVLGFFFYSQPHKRARLLLHSLHPALPGPAGRPVSRMSLGSRPTEIPALRHTLTPFGVRLYF